MLKKISLLCLSFLAVVSISFSKPKYDIRNFVKSMNLHNIEQFNNKQTHYLLPQAPNKSYTKKLEKVVQKNVELEEGMRFDAVSTLVYNNYDQIYAYKNELKLSGTETVIDEFFVIYHHNEEGLVDSYQSFFDEELSDQAEFKYNSSGLLITELYYWVDSSTNQLEQNTQIDNTYNDDNLLTEKTVHYFLDPDTKALSYIEKYHYNANKQLVKITVFYDEGDIYYDYYTKLTYNDNNQLTDIIEYTTVIINAEEEWTPATHTKFRYDDNGNTASEEVLKLDEETSDMILYSSTKWNFDDSIKWTDVLYPIIPDNDSPIRDYNYNMIEEEILYKYISDGTTDTVTTDFIYTDYNSIEENSILEASVFPNPTSDYITFSNAMGLINGKIVVYNIDGKIILNHTFTDNQSFDFSNVAKGTYFYKILSSNKVKYSGKFKVD